MSIKQSQIMQVNAHILSSHCIGTIDIGATSKLVPRTCQLNNDGVGVFTPTRCILSEIYKK